MRWCVRTGDDPGAHGLLACASVVVCAVRACGRAGVWVWAHYTALMLMSVSVQERGFPCRVAATCYGGLGVFASRPIQGVCALHAHRTAHAHRAAHAHRTAHAPALVLAGEHIAHERPLILTVDQVYLSCPCPCLFVHVPARPSARPPARPPASQPASPPTSPPVCPPVRPSVFFICWGRFVYPSTRPFVRRARARSTAPSAYRSWYAITI